MAQTTRDFFRVFGLLSIWFLVQKSHAFEYKVGGSQGWTDTNAAIYNPWAEKNRFQIGDTLLFVYPADQDSVLHVTKDDYTNCKTDSPLDKFTDGHSVYEFKQSGPHYFISGVADHCHKNEKLLVVVMADRSNHSSNGTAVSPPSPAPAGEESPSPPSPSPSEESSPPSPGSEAPSEVSDHPKNGAHSMVVNAVGTVVILVGSLLAFAI